MDMKKGTGQHTCIHSWGGSREHRKLVESTHFLLVFIKKLKPSVRFGGHGVVGEGGTFWSKALKKATRGTQMDKGGSRKEGKAEVCSQQQQVLGEGAELPNLSWSL